MYNAHREPKREAILHIIFHRRSYGYDSKKVMHNLTSLFGSEGTRVFRGSLKIDYILDICNIGIVEALSDEKTTRPAIMMHLTSIAEQFSKIKDNNILSNFNTEDVKGAINTRNFIAHDYEGINLPIIEFIIRERLPILHTEINKII